MNALECRSCGNEFRVDAGRCPDCGGPLEAVVAQGGLEAPGSEAPVDGRGPVRALAAGSVVAVAVFGLETAGVLQIAGDVPPFVPALLVGLVAFVVAHALGGRGRPAG